MVIEAARDVSLTKPMKLLDKGGMETFRAWGRMILFKVFPQFMPMEAAASHCPRGTDWIAARIVSEA